MLNKILFLILTTSTLSAHCINLTDPSKKDSLRKNEVSINFIPLIFSQKLNLNYERFLPKNTSLSIESIFYDFKEPIQIQNTPKTPFNFALKLKYNFYINPNKNHTGFSFFPLFQYSKFFDTLQISNSQFKKENEYYFKGGIGMEQKWIYKNKLGVQIGLNVNNVVYKQANAYKYPTAKAFLYSNIIYRF